MTHNINVTEKIFEISNNLSKLMQHVETMNRTLLSDHDKKNKLVALYADLERRVELLEESKENTRKFFNVSFDNVLKWLFIFALGITVIYNNSALHYMDNDLQSIKHVMKGDDYEKSND